MSYRKGLWHNIRKNRGSGKKPTAEMLKQEKKIKANTGKGKKYPDGVVSAVLNAKNSPDGVKKKVKGFAYPHQEELGIGGELNYGNTTFSGDLSKYYKSLRVNQDIPINKNLNLNLGLESGNISKYQNFQPSLNVGITKTFPDGKKQEKKIKKTTAMKKIKLKKLYPDGTSGTDGKKKTKPKTGFFDTLYTDDPNKVKNYNDSLSYSTKLNTTYNDFEASQGRDGGYDRTSPSNDKERQAHYEAILEARNKYGKEGVPFNKLPSTPGAINYNYGNDGSIIKPKQPYALTPKVPIKTKTQSAIDQIGNSNSFKKVSTTPTKVTATSNDKYANLINKGDTWKNKDKDEAQYSRDARKIYPNTDPNAKSPYAYISKNGTHFTVKNYRATPTTKWNYDTLVKKGMKVEDGYLGDTGKLVNPKLKNPNTRAFPDGLNGDSNKERPVIYTDDKSKVKQYNDSTNVYSRFKEIEDSFTRKNEPDDYYTNIEYGYPDRNNKYTTPYRKDHNKDTADDFAVGTGITPKGNKDVTYHHDTGNSTTTRIKNYDGVKPVQPYKYADPKIVEKQKMLKDAGLYKGPLDGIFGKNSKAALQKLEERNKPKKPANVDNPVDLNSVDMSFKDIVDKPKKAHIKYIPNNPGKAKYFYVDANGKTGNAISKGMLDSVDYKDLEQVEEQSDNEKFKAASEAYRKKQAQSGPPSKYFAGFSGLASTLTTALPGLSSSGNSLIKGASSVNSIADIGGKFLGMSAGITGDEKVAKAADIVNNVGGIAGSIAGAKRNSIGSSGDPSTLTQTNDDVNANKVVNEFDENTGRKVIKPKMDQTMVAKHGLRYTKGKKYAKGRNLKKQLKFKK